MRQSLQDILVRHWLFGTLPGRVIADLANQFSVKSYRKNQYVFHQDDPAARLYVVLEGEVSIETLAADGQVTKIAHLHAGEIFGEFALIDDGGRSAGAITMHKTELASLPGKVFHRLLDDYPEFSRRMLEVLVSRNRQSNSQIESLVTLSLLQRTARLLLQMSETGDTVLNITQEEFASRLFASREKVNGKLKEIEAAGAIKTGHGKITIINNVRLGRYLDLE